MITIADIILVLSAIMFLVGSVGAIWFTGMQWYISFMLQSVVVLLVWIFFKIYTDFDFI